VAHENVIARQAAEPRRQRYSPWRLIRANAHDLRILLRDSFPALAGLLLVVLVDALYLTTNPVSSATPQARFTPAEALYEALRLLIFQSSAPLPSDLVGQLLFFLTPLLGLGLLVQSASNFGRRLLNKGSRREVWQVALASTFHHHVVVCGLGRVGLRVATRLIESGYEVVAVERNWNNELVARALEQNIPVVVGDAREPTILRQAGLMRARAVVAGINGVLVNIEIALAARALRPRLPVVLRAFDEELDTGVEKVFGVDSTFSTSALAAPTFAAAVLSRGIDHVLPAMDAAEPLGVSHLALPAKSALAGPLSKFEEQFGVRVLAAGTGGHPPRWSPSARLRGGDRVAVVGSLGAIEGLRRRVEAETPAADGRRAALAESREAGMSQDSGDGGTVILCGLGKIGYRVVRQLLRRDPHPRIVVIQLRDDPASFVHRIDAPNVHKIFGDARNPEVLRQAGVTSASALAALTSDDLVNLQIGLAARRECDDVHLVLRVFSDALADKLVDMFGIHTTYSTSGLAAPTLAAAAILGGASHAFAIGGALYSTQEVVARAGDQLVGRSVAQIRQRDGRLVVGLCRAEQVCVLPQPDDAIVPGDRVTVLAPVTTLDARA
jgi:Trk K+ transport system NAD-binding subunit